MGELIRGISYKKEDASKSPSQGCKPILRANNIKGHLNFDELVYVPAKIIREEQYIKKGDLIFAMSSGSKHLVGKSAPALNDYDGSYGAFCALLRPSQYIDQSYFAYFFQGNTFRKLVSEIAKGTNINNLKREHILNIDFLLSPLPEQHQIVVKIEELFSELDNGIENLKKARGQLKTYRQAVLKYAFEGKLTKEWREKNKTAIWQELKLGDLIKVKSGNGLTKGHQVNTGNHLVYGGNGIMGKHNKYMFEEPKLIIGRVGVHCGNVHITKPTSWVTDNAFVTNFDNDQVEMKYLLYFISDLNLKKYSSSTAQPVISGGKIYPIDVKIPEKEEQQAIVSEIESRLSVCDKIEQTIEDSIKKAEALRQSILKKAFAGKLTKDWREKNPELVTGENSAEKLLEKIKSEKALAVGRGKPRSKKAKKK